MWYSKNKQIMFQLIFWLHILQKARGSGWDLASITTSSENRSLIVNTWKLILPLLLFEKLSSGDLCQLCWITANKNRLSFNLKTLSMKKSFTYLIVILCHHFNLSIQTSWKTETKDGSLLIGGYHIDFAKHWHLLELSAKVTSIIQNYFDVIKGDLALCCFLIGGYDIDSATSMSWVSGEDLAYTNW